MVSMRSQTPGDALPEKRPIDCRRPNRPLYPSAQRHRYFALRIAPLGNAAQVGRVLAKMVSDGRLVRVSKGGYAKTRVHKWTGKLAPAAPFESIAAETFRKLGIEVQPGPLEREYNAGLTSQIPTDGVVSTEKRRIRRRIHVGGKTVQYEKKNGRADG